MKKLKECSHLFCLKWHRADEAMCPKCLREANEEADREEQKEKEHNKLLKDLMRPRTKAEDRKDKIIIVVCLIIIISLFLII